MQGEDVTYTLNVKNEATATTIANMVVIDRLPYVGDIGVIAGYGRGSAFEVSYNGGLAVSVDGSTITVLRYNSQVMRQQQLEMVLENGLLKRITIQ